MQRSMSAEGDVSKTEVNILVCFRHDGSTAANVFLAPIKLSSWYLCRRTLEPVSEKCHIASTEGSSSTALEARGLLEQFARFFFLVSAFHNVDLVHSRFQNLFGNSIHRFESNQK